MNILSPSLGRRQPSNGEGDPLRASVLKILEGALTAFVRSGARNLSMSDISDASGVSRATLYRYFATKQDVLASVSEFVSVNFETGALAAADQHTDPIERFRAVMRFFAQFTHDRTPDRIFEIEPAFHLDFFRSHFDRHVAAVRAALSLTFDYIESRIKLEINRDIVSQALIRMQLSTLIVPAGDQWMRAWDDAPDRLERLILTLAGVDPANPDCLKSKET